MTNSLARAASFLLLARTNTAVSGSIPTDVILYFFNFGYCPRERPQHVGGCVETR